MFSCLEGHISQKRGCLGYWGSIKITKFCWVYRALYYIRATEKNRPINPFKDLYDSISKLQDRKV